VFYLNHGENMLADMRRTHLFIGKPDTEENRAGFVSTIPIGRPSTPSDIANACCYLASDEAAFITGVDLEVRFLFDHLTSTLLTCLSRSTEADACRKPMVGLGLE
jgi:hypothetical protein